MRALEAVCGAPVAVGYPSCDSRCTLLQMLELGEVGVLLVSADANFSTGSYVALSITYVQFNMIEKSF